MRLLVYHIGSLGDTLAVVPALWALRANFPKAHITMLTDSPPGKSLVQASDILAGSGLIDEYVFYFTTGWFEILRLLHLLRARKYHTLVYLVNPYATSQRFWRDKIFFRLAGIKGYIGMSRLPKESANNHVGPVSAVPRIADVLLTRLRADGLKTPQVGHGRADVNIGELEAERVTRWLGELPDAAGKPWIAIGLGSKMPCKVWPFERYLSVIRRLVEECDIWPVVFGGASDQEEAIKLIRELGRGYVAAGALGIRESMSAMKRCRLFLGNDTGTMHMAAASGVRCVVPFSSRDIAGKWAPYGNGHILFRTAISCEGCMLEKCVEKKMQCILSITAQQVYGACRDVLCK